MTRPRPISERIAEKVRVDSKTGCHEWTGGKNPAGYGHIWCNKTKGKIPAHRATYELAKGPIPKGMQLDHLCRNRGCVNPDHLEPVTIRENLLRGTGFSARNASKTHCKRGHEFTAENTMRVPGGRNCRECHRERDRRYGKAKRLKARIARATNA